MSINMGAEYLSTYMEETSIHHMPFSAIKEDESMCGNMNLSNEETYVSTPMSFTFEPEDISLFLSLIL